ncbi:hypothetical protein ALC57_11663, partial [Trachymyrmex cornetzi]
QGRQEGGRKGKEDDEAAKPAEGERRGGLRGGDTVITNHQGAASSWLPRRQQPDLL